MLIDNTMKVLRSSSFGLKLCAVAFAVLIIGVCGVFLFAGSTTTAEKAVNLRIAPETLSASFAEVAKQVESSVVNIDTKTNAPEIAVNKSDKPKKTPNNSDDEDDAAILDYFRRNMPSRPSYGVGSGFIVDAKGYVITNYHVIEDANRIIVKLEGGEEFIAQVVGTDEETDVAVLKINAGKDLPAVKLGDSTIAQVGDWVLAIGSPFGLDQTVTAGIISQVGRQTPYATSFQRFIQTDAAINRGNSGGPLVNMRGEVVGINSQIATSTGDYNGIGFALPSNEVNYVYNQILQNGKVRRGFLGVTLDSVKTEFAKVYGLSEAKGAIVISIQDEKGAAAIAGLQENDVILQFNSQTIENAQDLIAKVASTTPSQKVQVVYLREINGNLEKRSTQLTLGERPNLLNEKAVKLKTEKTTPTGLPQLGLTLTELTPQLITSNNLGNQTGLLVKEVNPNGIIADVKLQGRGSAVTKNDLITRINRVPVKTNAEFGAIINKFKAGDAVVLHVARYDLPSKKIVTRIVQFTFQ